MAQKKSSERLVREIKRNTRRKFSSEEKIRIVIDGLRGETSKAELCRREGIPQNLGNKINSTSKDGFPYVTPDGKYFFYNSNRVSILNDKDIPDGPGNIYWVDAGYIEEFK